MAKKKHSLIILGVVLLLVIVVVAMFLKRYKEGFNYCTTSPYCSATNTASTTLKISDTNVLNYTRQGYSVSSLQAVIGNITNDTGIQSSSISFSSGPTYSYSYSSLYVSGASAAFTIKSTVASNKNTTKTSGDFYLAKAPVTLTLILKNSSGNTKSYASSTTVYCQLFVPSSTTTTNNTNTLKVYYGT